MFLQRQKNNIKWYAKIIHKNKNKMLENKRQNDSYQNTNRNDNVFLPKYLFFCKFHQNKNY